MNAVLEHYLSVLTAMGADHDGELRLPSPVERLEQANLRAREGLQPGERGPALAAMDGLNARVRSAVEALGPERWTRAVQVRLGDDDPFPASPEDVVGWLTGHYEEHVPQARDLLREWRDGAVQAFAGQVFGDLTGLTNSVLAGIGDRLGLFKDLAASGPATSAELAARAGVDERYAREWLGGMASAGYLAYDPATGRFTLPAEHVPVVAEEGGAIFLGGPLQEMLGTLATLDRVVDAFRHGGGVAIPEFSPDTWEGLERFTNGWFNNLLVQQWLPLMPDVTALLDGGADVADVGCGHGRALITLAGAFPRGRYVGYDVSEAAIERARANAEQAGVADRVRFEVRDVSGGLPATYDVVTTFDVVHDAVDPRGMLRAIRQAVRPDGFYVCLDVNCSDRLEENAGPKGAFFHGVSILLCMTMSLAGHGKGLGTLGLPESRLTELCHDAGFGSVRRVPMDNPFNNLYEIRPGGDQ